MRISLYLRIAFIVFSVNSFDSDHAEHPCALLEDPDALLSESRQMSESGQAKDAFACLHAGVEKFAEFADVWVCIASVAR